MCGVVGILSSNVDNIFNKTNQLLKIFKHRGPDNTGIWIDKDNQISLGHLRLSILDLSSSGNQPMSSSNDRYKIVYNGEIYNFKSLKLELEKENNIKWKSSTDTEVLLEYISNYGLENSLKKINGMYAFGLWDKKEKKLIICRDRFGEKPLYYGWIGKDFVFCSEINPIRKIYKENLKINKFALSLYTQYGYVPSPYSIYDNVFKLEAGTFIEISKKKERFEILKKQNFFNPVNEYNQLNDNKTNIEKIHQNLINSVSEKLVADVPVGVFLSGGIDSSLITSIAQKKYYEKNSKPIKTFTIGFKDEKYDESIYAKKISSFLKTDHHEEILGKKEIIDIIPNLNNVYGEPFADYSSIPTYLVSKLAKKNVKVVLSGDGGDEIFGGYVRYFYAKRIDSFKNFFSPKFLKIIKKILLATNPKFFDKIYDLLSSFLFQNNISFIGDKVHKFGKVIDSADEKEIYFKIINLWENCISESKYFKEFSSTQNEKIWNSQISIERKMMLSDLENYLVDDILVKVDRASMYNSLECRAPFLDYNIFQETLKLKNNQLFFKSEGKIILKKILNEYLPKKLFKRPKMGFGFNLGKYLKIDLKDWVYSLINNKSLDHGLFDNKQILEALDDHIKNRKDNTHKLWSILAFQDWYLSNND